MERQEIEQAIKEIVDKKRLMNQIPFYHVKPYIEASIRFEMEMLKRDAIKEAWNRHYHGAKVENVIIDEEACNKGQSWLARQKRTHRRYLTKLKRIIRAILNRTLAI